MEETSSAADFLPPRLTLPALREAVQGCRGCRLYKNATTGDYVSTVDDAVPSGYTWAGNIGWILPRE